MAHGGKNDVTTHVKGKRHRDLASASSSSKSVTSFFNQQVSHGVIQAEALWSTFVVEHNIAFKASNHATKLFHKMFPDSEIAKKFACGRTKTAAIIKGALAPHHTETMLDNLKKSGPYSVMMDESNDKTNKSCIILIKILDHEIGDVRTKFLDMPIVNIGNARNPFDALKSSLSSLESICCSQGCQNTGCCPSVPLETRFIKGKPC